MKTVTKIKIQNSDKNRVNLYLDGKFFCGLELETVVKNGIKVGTIITEETRAEETRSLRGHRSPSAICLPLQKLRKEFLILP